jgi:imidazole glycerol-phosphate synthase subunit HisF
VLRKRLITALTFNDGVLFRTKLFEPDYRYTTSFVDTWSIDEIVVLDVTREQPRNREAFSDAVQQFARNCFVPLAAGGGVRTINDVKELLAVGADKVIVNTGALERPELITEIAQTYGTQCVVVSIDVRREPEGGYRVYSDFASTPTYKAPDRWAREAEALGAGEILVTAVERDGALQGYDLDLCQMIAEAVQIPVLILGGAGNWKHFAEGFSVGKASAVCTQNIYHFTESSIRSAKNFLTKKGVHVRN